MELQEETGEKGRWDEEAKKLKLEEGASRE